MIKNVNAPTKLVWSAAEIMAQIKSERRDRTRDERFSATEGKCQWKDGCDTGLPVLASKHCRAHYWKWLRRNDG